MLRTRPAAARGHADHGWLDTHHTFSFADYHDPAHMGFRSLRVINEDVVQPGRGFGTHPHRDMEILTWVLDGALEHKDSMGHGSVIRPGELQRMSAGTGVTHSEVNASRGEPVHLLQIWLLPERLGLVPGYEQTAFPDAELRNRLHVVAERSPRDGAVTVHQDVRLLVGRLDAGTHVEHELAPGRHAWVQVARGRVGLVAVGPATPTQVEVLGGRRPLGAEVERRPADRAALGAGDGAAVSDRAQLVLTATEDAEVLLFDLA